MPRSDEEFRKPEDQGKLSEETRREVFVEKERSARNEDADGRQYSGSSPPRSVGGDKADRGMGQQ